MTGRLVVLGIVLTALVAGGAMYWLQIYAFYDRLDPAAPAITLVPEGGGDPVPLEVTGFEGIDSDSSPIRYRACFAVAGDPAALAGVYAAHEEPTPLLAPGWFECFDAEAIALALASGEARAYLGAKNARYGADLVVAVYPDGRGYAWRQLNDCGEKAWDGTVVGEECPPLEATR